MSSRGEDWIDQSKCLDGICSRIQMARECSEIGTQVDSALASRNQSRALPLDWLTLLSSSRLTIDADWWSLSLIRKQFVIRDSAPLAQPGNWTEQLMQQQMSSPRQLHPAESARSVWCNSIRALHMMFSTAGRYHRVWGGWLGRETRRQPKPTGCFYDRAIIFKLGQTSCKSGRVRSLPDIRAKLCTIPFSRGNSTFSRHRWEMYDLAVLEFALARYRRFYGNGYMKNVSRKSIPDNFKFK